MNRRLWTHCMRGVGSCMFIHVQTGICRPLLSYRVAGTVGSKCGT